jgi:amino acid transporter
MAEPADGGETQLNRGALGLPAITFQGVTHMAPAAGVMLSAPFIATFAGPAMGLAFGLAGIIALLLAHAVAQLARHLPSAGGFFSYISRALSPKLGFLVSWVYFLYDALVPVLCTVIIGGYAQSTLKSEYGWYFPWWLYAVIVWLALGVISYYGIKVSIVLAIALTLIEVGITMALSFWIFGKHGIHAHDLKYGFTLDGIPKPRLHGLFLGMVFSVLSYTGFESTAPLAEETRNPKRNLPRAIYIGTAVILVYYVIFGFATTIGFGTDRVTSAFPSSANPYYGIAKSVWGGSGTILILLALINSGWGCSLAGQSAVVRVYYKMASVGVFPRQFARLHPKHKSPHVAIGVQTVFNIVFGIFCGITLGTVNTFGVLGAMITFGMVFVYGSALVAVPVFFWREHRDEFGVINHVVLPALGILSLAPVFYYNIVPFPPFPFEIAPIAVMVWLVIGIGVVAYLSKYRSKQLAASARLILDE